MTVELLFQFEARYIYTYIIYEVEEVTDKMTQQQQGQEHESKYQVLNFP